MIGWWHLFTPWGYFGYSLVTFIYCFVFTIRLFYRYQVQKLCHKLLRKDYTFLISLEGEINVSKTTWKSVPFDSNCCP